MLLTYQFRIKDKHASRLNAQARAATFVWNYCNETQQKAARDGRRWLTGYDLINLTSGAAKEGLDLHSHTIQRICLQYDKARRQSKKPWLRWRSKRSLGWVPFNTGIVTFRNGGFDFRGDRYDAWIHRAVPNGKQRAGAFSRDTRGRWYIAFPVEVNEARVAPIAYVGIDLGLKDFATLSTGKRIPAPRLFRKGEEKLAMAQRHSKTKRARAIYAKIANQRKDFLHKESAKIAKEYGFVAIGNISPSRLAKTSMAKSVLDAGWARFKEMLAWKLRLRSGGMLLEVPEKYTSQICSECGSMPLSRPRGIADLDKRMWRCDDCGTDHDRDVNAARNILRIGLDTLRGASVEEQPHRIWCAESQISDIS